MYMMRGGPKKTRTLEYEIHHRTAVRSPKLAERHNLEMFEVSPKDRHLHNVSGPAFWQNIETLRMLCVPSPPIFANCFKAFGDKAPSFGHLLLKRRRQSLRLCRSYVSFRLLSTA